jgi:hypothetical protein
VPPEPITPLGGRHVWTPAEPKPIATPSQPVPSVDPAKPAKRKRLSNTITSRIAADKLEAFLDASPVQKSEFARKIDTTERTLLNFRRTGKIKRKTFNLIANEMGLTPEELLKPV